MRKIADYELWVGNAGDIQNPRSLFDLEIAAIVELADSETFVPLPRELVRSRFPLSDGGENPLWLLRLAAQTIQILLSNKIPVLVCCSGGMSRSVALAASALSLLTEKSLSETIGLVAKSGPADVCPGLLAQCHEAIRVKNHPSTPVSD